MNMVITRKCEVWLLIGQSENKRTIQQTLPLVRENVLSRVLYYAGDKTVGQVEIPQSGKVHRTKDVIRDNDNDNEKDSPISVALDGSTRKLYWTDGNDEYVNVYDLEAEKSVSFDLQG